MLLSPSVDNYDVKLPDREPESLGLVATLTLKVIDRQGRVKSKLTLRSHSPTYNLYAMLGMLGSLGGTATDTSGTAWNISSYAVVKANSISIMVGSGTSSNPFNQTKLVAPIANGTGSGQLVYGNINFSSSPAVSGNSMSFLIYNVFTNESNTVVTVTEIGLVANYTFGIASPSNFLLWYDNIPTISLAPGDALAVTYTFTINP
ncbi:hypothetical protein [Acidilobus sp.]|uniref:hypothetical protein n=1 Tax=Acidilobus sp. TaxID=1872109 RepID=UPI003CFE60B6